MSKTSPSLGSRSAALLEKLVVRPATLADRDDVMAITSGLYEGLDYLPSMYDQYMLDPNRRGQVGWLDGRAVSLILLGHRWWLYP